MLFNSKEFLLFFPLVTVLYYLLPHKYRWSMLLLASCLFYMFFIPVYIFILFITILIDYLAGIQIEKSTGRKRKWWLILSIISTCAVLFSFKYFNFFAENINRFAEVIGWNYSITILQLILPIGLSFHTFQSLSYVIEVYRGNFKSEKHFGIYSLYVMFYPQLVAGPIERPQNLIHQFREFHPFKYAQVTSGMKLMAWGLFKKVVIADRLSLFVDNVYTNPMAFESVALITATIFFAFQIYCDFSGYSDIAIGAAEVIGIKLMLNFNRPYHSRSISEFWKKWHISLSTWLKDYIYIPLGGNRVPAYRIGINLLITLILSGIWHGANWTFVTWGLIHAIYSITGMVTKKLRTHLLQRSGIAENNFAIISLEILINFMLVCTGWIFFRANNMEEAIYILKQTYQLNLVQLKLVAFNDNFRATHLYLNMGSREFIIALFGILSLEIIHVMQGKHSMRSWLSKQAWFIRWPSYYLLISAIIYFGVFNKSQFIYFQF